ncbi:hypothetical protein MKX03_004350, partial [Papaver bracteatum]
MNLLVLLFLNDTELGCDKELFMEMSERNRSVILLYAQMVTVGKRHYLLDTTLLLENVCRPKL